MQEFFDWFLVLDPEFFWILKVFLIVLFTTFGSFIAGRIILRAEKRAAISHNLWDDALVYALRRTIRLLIWVVGLTFACEVALSGDNSRILDLIYNGRDVGVIFALAWFALRFIKSIERNILYGNAGKALKIDRTTIRAVAKLLRVTVVITSLLVGMQTLGFSVNGVLAFGGIGGMAVGFASKDLLANFFGALMIYFDRPFDEGDWIRSPDKEIEGTVEEIGWRQTRIRTFDKRPIYVPNSVFSTIVVENPSRMSHRRINEVIGIRYSDIAEVNKITSDVEKMLHNHSEIDTTQTLMVHFDAFSPSSLDFFIYTFTKTTDWVKFHAVKQDVLLKIADIISANNAEIAFPTRTLHMVDECGKLYNKSNTPEI